MKEKGNFRANLEIWEGQAWISRRREKKEKKILMPT
jgi:hypothetical protein